MGEMALSRSLIIYNIRYFKGVLLKQYKGTINFVSHDRKFTENVSTRIVDIHNRALTVFDGTYKQYKNRNPIKEYDLRQNELLLRETKIAEVVSRLSVSPTDELEKEFQRLLSEKENCKSKVMYQVPTLFRIVSGPDTLLAGELLLINIVYGRFVNSRSCMLFDLRE